MIKNTYSSHLSECASCASDDEIEDAVSSLLVESSGFTISSTSSVGSSECSN